MAFLRRLRDLLVCFWKTVVVIDDVLDDVEEVIEMKKSVSSQTVKVDL